MISFFLPCDPPRTTAQQKGERICGKTIRHYDKRSVKDAKTLFRSLLAQYAPEQPLDGPIRLQTKWYFSTANKKQHYSYKITRPDNSNSIKLLEDVMTELGFWHDDAQIALSVQQKVWVWRDSMVAPGIYVDISKLPDKEEIYDSV